jgi:hypothetical protein
MLGQDDKSHLPTGMNCLVFDDVMYKSPDQRNCMQKTLTSVPSSSRWLLRGVGGYLEAGRTTVLLGVAARSGHKVLLRILAQRHLTGEPFGRLRWNCKDYNRRVFDASGVFISLADYDGACVRACCLLARARACMHTCARSCVRARGVPGPGLALLASSLVVVAVIILARR